MRKKIDGGCGLLLFAKDCIKNIDSVSCSFVCKVIRSDRAMKNVFQLCVHYSDLFTTFSIVIDQWNWTW